jgi:S-adenosylmethionine decarboxylase
MQSFFSIAVLKKRFRFKNEIEFFLCTALIFRVIVQEYAYRSFKVCLEISTNRSSWEGKLRFLYFFIGAFSILFFSSSDAEEQYRFFGEHLIASYSDCDIDALSDVTTLISVMEEATKMTGATILDLSCHIFPPTGLTMVILLSESHATIHTYPEHRACFVDIFTCGGHCAMEKFDKALQDYLLPKSVSKGTLIRDHNMHWKRE